jgi:hypothetical protein
MKIEILKTVAGYGDDEVKFIRTADDRYWQISICHAKDIPDKEYDAFNDIEETRDFDSEIFSEFTAVECLEISVEEFIDVDVEDE